MFWLWFHGMVGRFYHLWPLHELILSCSLAYASSAWFTPFKQVIPWSLRHNMNNILSSSQRHSKLWFEYIEPEKKWMIFLSHLSEKPPRQTNGTNGPSGVKQLVKPFKSRSVLYSSLPESVALHTSIPIFHCHFRCPSLCHC